MHNLTNKSKTKLYYKQKKQTIKRLTVIVPLYKKKER